MAVWCHAKAPYDLVPLHQRNIVPSSTHTSVGRRALRRWGPGLADTTPAWLCLASSGSSPHTTPFSQSSLESVTITHPHHPLRGQRVMLVRIRQGVDPDLIVQLPDGTHTALAMSSTDYAGTPAAAPPGDPTPLLALEGLRQVVRLVERCRQQKRGPTSPAASIPPHWGDTPYDEGR